MGLHHTTECIVRTSAVEREMRDWIRTWHNYCTACGAQGGDWFPDEEEAGESENRTFDLCGFCVLLNMCPRCGMYVEGLREGKERDVWCPHCHWRWGGNRDDSIPELPDCLCPDPVDVMGRLLEEHLSPFQEALMFIEQHAVLGDLSFELIGRMRGGIAALKSAVGKSAL